MVNQSEIIAHEIVVAADASPPKGQSLPKASRWLRRTVQQAQSIPAALSTAGTDSSADGGAVQDSMCPPPAAVGHRRQRDTKCRSFIVQHYHSTGCAGGAFSWRASKMDPNKDLYMCMAPREYRATTMGDIALSVSDKQRGGGPRVGPFQASIPGDGWTSLPKYDWTTQKRSSAFNERMHVEWENHADHILANGGELPIASVVAKAGVRSCAPCCRDMIALARPTGKTFIMVDLAEDDKRGTFHFVTGDRYLPVPKEDCSQDDIAALKKVVLDAQENRYDSSEAIYDAVLELNVPIDKIAQSMYLGDRALLPSGIAAHLRGKALMEVLHAEHFARLSAEYGASILRDPEQPASRQQAIRECRQKAKHMLASAWRLHLSGDIDVDAYARAATLPLLPDDATAYTKAKSLRMPAEAATPLEPLKKRSDRRWGLDGPKKASLKLQRLTADGLTTIGEDDDVDSDIVVASSSSHPVLGLAWLAGKGKGDDSASSAGASTALPENGVSALQSDDDSVWSNDIEDPLYDP